MKRRRKEQADKPRYLPDHAQIEAMKVELRREREAGTAPKRQYNRSEASVRMVEGLE